MKIPFDYHQPSDHSVHFDKKLTETWQDDELSDSHKKLGHSLKDLSEVSEEFSNLNDSASALLGDAIGNATKMIDQEKQ